MRKYQPCEPQIYASVVATVLGQNHWYTELTSVLYSKADTTYTNDEALYGRAGIYALYLRLSSYRC